MPIQSTDIKLIKSAVLADTSDGGGPMTGVPLVSGMSNNLFPDISDTDRALGRVQMRKVFGVAQSADTDTLLGAHAVITKPPSDHNVVATLFQTGGWGDERTEAVKTVERYLVQGSRAPVRIYETHFIGSLQLRLYMIGSGTFPAAGECIVLVNPARIGTGDAFQQFVRVQDYSLVEQQQTIVEGGTPKDVMVRIATYSIEQPLKIDIYGPPVCRIFGQDGVQPEDFYAKVYNTSIADSGRFFGIKPLSVAATAGDYSVTVDSIFSPLVPSATQETPVVDAQPTVQTSILVDSSYGFVNLSTAQTTLTLQLPSSVAPFGLSIDTYSNISIDGAVDNGNGQVYKDALLLATVDYSSGLITFLAIEYYTIYGGVIGFGTSVRYKPEVSVPCDVLTTSLTVTQSNQGLNFVNLLNPPPAKGTLTIDYVAQGRWYSLTADQSGRIGGGNSAYGSGSVSSITGSVSLTLGAMPDIGSSIVMSWGANTTTIKPASASLPTKFSTLIDVGFDVYPVSRTLAWTDRDGYPRTATVASTGLISGDATGAFISPSAFIFSPDKFPNLDGVTLGYRAFTSAPKSSFANVSSGVVQLDVSAGVIEQGTVFFMTMWGSATVNVFDRSGAVFGELPNGATVAVGAINYATGVVTFNPSFTISVTEYGYQTNTIAGWSDVGVSAIGDSADRVYQFTGIYSAHYYSASSAGATTSVVLRPIQWRCAIPVPLSNGDSVAAMLPASLTIKHGDGYYVADADGKLHSIAVRGQGYLGERNIGTVGIDGIIRIDRELLPNVSGSSRSNTFTVLSVLTSFQSLGVDRGVFRTQNFPLKPSNFQMYGGSGLQAVGTELGALSGGFTGFIDYKYGVVKWVTAGNVRINPSTIRYNAVALLSLPLNPDLLGLDTARLPTDGRVPIYRKGDLLLVHNTQQFTVQSPVQKGVAYTLGRTNLSSVEVVDASGTLLPESLYTVDLAAGELTFSTGTDTSGFAYPWEIEHMVSDMVLCTSTDISGLLKTARALEHDYSAGTSYVSSLLVFGDLFARAYGDFAQQAWTSVWSDSRIGSEILANYNNALYPIVVTNTGAIRERWALIFTSTTAYRVIGEDSGQIGTGTTTADCSPINPATGVPYFTVRSAGFGSGWSTGNVLRFNTDTAGNPFWILRTTLQGQAQADNDVFRVAFRGSVNRV